MRRSDRDLRADGGLAYKDTSNPLYYVPRGVKLYSDRFVTYHEDDPSDHKTWKLYPGTRLEPETTCKITEVHKLVRPAKTSTLRAAWSGRGTQIDLFCFTIVAPAGRVHRPSGQSKVVLGWKDRDAALRMYEHFHEVIKALAGAQAQMELRHQDSFTSVASNPVSPEPSASERQVPTQRAGTLAQVADLAREMNSNHPMAKRWVPYKHSNGLAIYYHESPGEESLVGGEYMVSAIVRGSPQECLAILMNPQSNTTLLGPASKVDVLHMDGDSQMLRLELEAGGLSSYLFAPRECIIRKFMRKEEDGVYTIMFENVSPAEQQAQQQQEQQMGEGDEEEEEESDQRRRPSWFRRPVKAWVKGGYSICRLEDCPSDQPSPETLIHCILNVDLGGQLLGQGSWGHQLFKALGVVDSFVDRMLMSVILVRDEVELQRFVVKPFTCFSATAAIKQQQQQHQPHGAGKDVVGRTATMLVSRRADSSGGAGLGGTFRKISTLVSRQGSLALADAAQHAAAAEQQQDSSSAAGGQGSEESPWPCGTLPGRFWCELHVLGQDAPFKVRGRSYHLDRVKVEAGSPEYRLQSVDLVNCGKPGMQHVARFLHSVRRSSAPFSFVANLVVPGTPQLNLVITFASDRHPNSMGTPPADGAGWRPFDLVMHKFYNSTDSERNNLFKLIPHIAHGSWLIQQSVGTTPVMLGKKIATTYHRTERYIEVDLDTSSSSAANYITGMVRGATKSLVVDLSFLLEGVSAAELPESLVGAVRFRHLDLSTFTDIDTGRELPFAPSCPSRSCSGTKYHEELLAAGVELPGSVAGGASFSSSARTSHSRHSSTGDASLAGLLAPSNSMPPPPRPCSSSGAPRSRSANATGSAAFSK